MVLHAGILLGMFCRNLHKTFAAHAMAEYLMPQLRDFNVHTISEAPVLRTIKLN